MKKRIALALGSMALFGLMSTASAAVSYSTDMSALGKCGDPGMISSPACDSIAKDAGLSMAQRTKIANHVDCTAIAEKLGQYAVRKTTQRTRQEI